MTDILPRLKKYIEANGLTIAQFAENADLPKQRVYKWLQKINENPKLSSEDVNKIINVISGSPSNVGNQRIHYLENEVNQLRLANAALLAEKISLEKRVEELIADKQNLFEIMKGSTQTKFSLNEDPVKYTPKSKRRSA